MPPQSVAVFIEYVASEGEGVANNTYCQCQQEAPNQVMVCDWLRLKIRGMDLRILASW